MKLKRILAFVLAMLMLLALTACGSDETGDEGENSDVPPVENNENTGSESGNTSLDDIPDNSLFKLLEFTTVPDGLVGSSWEFAGGYVNGVQLTDEDYQKALEQYNGQLEIVFDDESNITMVQGGGSLSGSYAVVEDNTLNITFDNNGSALKYAGVFSTMDNDTCIMVLLSDSTGLNGLYFQPIIEG